MPDATSSTEKLENPSKVKKTAIIKTRTGVKNVLPITPLGVMLSPAISISSASLDSVFSPKLMNPKAFSAKEQYFSYTDVQKSPSS